MGFGGALDWEFGAGGLPTWVLRRKWAFGAPESGLGGMAAEALRLEFPAVLEVAIRPGDAACKQAAVAMRVGGAGGVGRRWGCWVGVGIRGLAGGSSFLLMESFGP